MPTPEPPTRRPGRRLPTTLADLEDNQSLTEPAKVLMLDLITLLLRRYGSVTGMIKAAMASPDRPNWARGVPTNPKHVEKAKSAVSKKIGHAAERPVDWSTVVWLVRHCAEPGEAEELTPVLAGRWCHATGETRPRGYLGPIQHDHTRESALADPADAADDTTRLHLVEAQLRQARQRNAELESAVAELESNAQRTTRVLGQQALTIRRLERGNAELQQTNTRLQTDERHGQQRQAEQTRQLQRLVHDLAVLIADRATSYKGRERRLVPLGLDVDEDLADLLNPPFTDDATHLAQWRGAYLNALLRISSPTGSIDPGLRKRVGTRVLDSVLTGAWPLTPDLVDKIAYEYPVAGPYLRTMLALAPPDDEADLELPQRLRRAFVTVPELQAREATSHSA